MGFIEHRKNEMAVCGESAGDDRQYLVDETNTMSHDGYAAVGQRSHDGNRA
jgi:hypothetical protein